MPGKKSWFRYHWILSLIFILIIIGVIGIIIFSLFKSPSSSSNEEKITEIGTQETKQYINEDLYTIISHFIEPVSTLENPLTNLQQTEKRRELSQEFNKNYKGKWIKSSGEVWNIEEDIFNKSIITITLFVNSENRSNDLKMAFLDFDESGRETLLKLKQYDKINFEGRIEDYSIIYPSVRIKDARLLK